MAVWENPPVSLWVDFDFLDAFNLCETSHVNFVVEVSNVGNDGVVLHLGHVGSHDNVFVSGSGDENIASLKDVLFPDDWDSLRLAIFSSPLPETKTLSWPCR